MLTLVVYQANQAQWMALYRRLYFYCFPLGTEGDNMLALYVTNNATGYYM